MRYVFVKIFGLKTILLLKWFGAENISLVRGRLVLMNYWNSTFLKNNADVKSSEHRND